jgi:magnesium chelatase family protein
LLHLFVTALNPFVSSSDVRLSCRDFLGKKRAFFFGFGLKNANKATQGCPCGYYNHPEKECVCPPGAVQKYLSKVSGPLLDRIDLHVEVTPVNFNELASDRPAEKSESIRERVIKAREIQLERFGHQTELYANAQMNSKMLREVCKISDAGQNLLKKAMEKLGLSARAYDRILKVARTIADLAGSPDIQLEHLAEAIHFRSLDREGWAG